MYMFTLEHIIKPFNTRIIKPRKVFPPCSNQLYPHRKAANQCEISERNVEDIYIYEIIPKLGTTPTSTEKIKLRKKRIYYFYGGAWQIAPSSQHWGLCVEMVKELPNTNVSVVSYPWRRVVLRRSRFHSSWKCINDYSRMQKVSENR